MRKRTLAVAAAVVIAAGGTTWGLVLTASRGLAPAQRHAQTDRWLECHVNPGGGLLPGNAALNREYWQRVDRLCRGSEGSLPPG
jgi:hypothetical protein